MAIPVEMPKMSDTMEEGVLVAWLEEEGAEVSAGDVIAQVETDKATMDLEVYDDGVLLKRVIEEGQAVPIGGLIAVLGKEGEDISGVLAQYETGGDGAASPAETVQAASAESTSETEAPAPSAAPTEAADSNGDARIKASPLARRMAREQNLDLRSIDGSGPDGRIVKRDIEAAMGKAPAPAEPAAEPAEAPRPAAAPPARPKPREEAEYEAVPLSQMRKTIARRLSESKFSAPHFYLTVDVDMEKAIAFRKQLNAVAEEQGRAKVSFNDLVIKASAKALRRHPAVNSAYLEKEGEIRRYKQVHVGVAVAIDEGLLTPVVRNADGKGLSEIGAEVKDFAARARDRKLQPEDWEGSTFTTSNLGMFGIERFTAIINPPSSCILAIGAIRDAPVVKNGEVVPGKMMTLTLSCDHRAVDGATGAGFLADLKNLLEEPMTMLL